MFTHLAGAMAYDALAATNTPDKFIEARLGETAPPGVYIRVVDAPEARRLNDAVWAAFPHSQDTVPADDPSGGIYMRKARLLTLATETGTDRVVGALWAQQFGPYRESIVLVHPDHRRRGIGLALVTEAACELANRGVLLTMGLETEAGGALAYAAGAVPFITDGDHGDVACLPHLEVAQDYGAPDFISIDRLCGRS